MSPTSELTYQFFTKMPLDQVTAINIENRGWQPIKPGSFELLGSAAVYRKPGTSERVISDEYELGYHALAPGGYREDGSYHDDEYQDEVGLITEILAVR